MYHHTVVTPTINNNSLVSSYIQIICFNQNAYKVYPLQLVEVSFTRVLLI